jgi:hypothetical protein
MLFADVFVPPIPIGVDYLALGYPVGVFVAVGALGASIALGVLLRRRKVHGLLALLAAALLFAVGDCAAWKVGLDRRHQARTERFERSSGEPEAAVTSASALPGK